MSKARSKGLSLLLPIFVALVFATLPGSFVRAQGTGFSFQGRLNDGTNPANGQYDLQFRLFDAITGAGQIGSTLARPATVLINGVFSVNLDFGASAFNNPSAVFIEIGVKPAGSPNAYTILGPRQQLTVVPFAVRANNATNADLASTAINAQNAYFAALAEYATTANNALSLGGVLASGYAQLNTVNTGDLRTNGALAITGDAFQPAAGRGLVKAMIEVNGDGTILRCYNGITNTSTGGCGFIVTNPLFGVFRINYGFQILSNFVAVTSRYSSNGSAASNNSGANYRVFDGNSIEVFTYSLQDSSDTFPKAFTIILF